jgi:hypothetical protein
MELATLCLDLDYKLAEHPKDLTRDQIMFLMASLAHRMAIKENARLSQAGVNRIVVTEGDDETE